MKTGIVGLVQTGKTTIFNILTGATAATGAGARKEANLGVAPIPDDRLTRLSALFEPQKTIPATAQYVDLPGVEPSGMKESAFLTGLRAVDALLHVVRAFHDEAVPHPAGSVDPARDVANMELEMIFADLFQVERRLERLDKDLKKIKDKDLEAERDLLERFKAHLEQEKPLRELALTPEEDRRVRGFTFLSQKPILHVINMDEGDAAALPRVVDHFGLAGWAARPEVVIAGVCGKIEEELTRLSPEEATEFMADLGIAESGTRRLLRDNYAAAGPDLLLHRGQGRGARLDHPAGNPRPAGRRDDPLGPGEGLHPRRGLPHRGPAGPRRAACPEGEGAPAARGEGLRRPGRRRVPCPLRGLKPDGESSVTSRTLERRAARLV